jgi:PIN domain nuclease of toxin-antitoxin system
MTLLDTHALLWLALEPQQLSKKAAERIRHESEKGELAIAAVTCWELALLCARRRIAFTGTIASYIGKLSSRTTILPLTPEIAAAGAELDRGFPKDPADRLIAATALVHGISLITKDTPIRQSGVVPTIW